MADGFQDGNRLPEQPSDELLDLIWRRCEGSLDRDGSDRLDNLLLMSAKNRAFYCDFLQVAAWLEFEQPAVRSLMPNLPGEHDESGFAEADQSLDRRSSGFRIADRAVTSVSGGETVPARIVKKLEKQGARRCLGISACVAILAALTGLAISNFKGQDEFVVAGKSEEAIDVITIKLATAESRKLPIADFGSISIQGPAHVDLVGSTHARLYQGRVKVRIDDERGHGFFVETPRGKVTDLGTEFGVDVSNDSNTGVVVFEGAVDLSLGDQLDRSPPRIERLLQGEGLSLHEAGRIDRIMSVITGNVTTFQRRGERRLGGSVPVIADVSDNIRSTDFKKFYEIVPAGMREDALAYADRPGHEWNGADAKGLPPYLVGADYVKPFNSDKMRDDVEILVSLAQPARLFVLLDDRVSPPDWLRESFRDTGDEVGLDCGPFTLDGTYYWFGEGKGAGDSVEVKFSIWTRDIRERGVVRLGPNSGASFDTGMYAVAAIPLVKEVP